ncbi:prefoldin subunit alpha [Candidatus Pacearchaeota archaeon]|nr:prefoldin subunit alpha [Candidatus Pacearchaeota archaeon]
MTNEELLYQAMVLQKNSEEVERNLNFVNEQIQDFEQFSENLRFLESEENKDILAALGKGVFGKAKLEDKKLFVSVGAGVVVRKTPSDTIRIIEKQLKKFNEARIALKSQLEEYTIAFREIMKKAEELKKRGD